MRITKVGIYLVALILVFSIFVANILNLISTEINEEQGSAQLSSLIKQRDLKIGDSKNHLMWFVQVKKLNLQV